MIIVKFWIGRASRSPIDDFLTIGNSERLELPRVTSMLAIEGAVVGNSRKMADNQKIG